MGEGLPFQRWRFDSRFAAYPYGVKLQRAPSEYIGSNILITTSGVCSHPTLVGAIAEMGAEAVMFSIDYPVRVDRAGGRVHRIRAVGRGDARPGLLRQRRAPVQTVTPLSWRNEVMQKTYRIGQIVPSSNTTMETEIPAMLLARQQIRGERFTFHSSRMRMKKVVKEELAAMDAESDRCAVELSDARVDVLGYACLVAIMAMGRGITASRRRG